VYYVIVICNLDPGIEATACACEILYVYVYVYTYNGRPIKHRRLYDLWNGTIFNDLERPLLPVSRSRHSVTLNISETVRDADIVLMKYYRHLHTPYSKVSFRIILSELGRLSKIVNDTKRRAVSARQLSFLLVYVVDERSVTSQSV